MSPIPLPGTNRDLLVMHRRSVRSQLLCCATVLAVGSACASAIPVGMPNGGVSTSSPPDVKPSDPRSADPRAADPRSPEPRSTEPTKTDRRMPEPSASGGSFGGAPGAGTRIESANADVIMPRLTSWPVRTAEHVDLWLHAFALLSNDTSMLPDFAPRYRDSLIVVKNRATVFTSLDSNYAVLSRGLAARGRYARAQLLPLEFSTWDVFRRQAELFLSSSDPSRSSFAAAFPSAVDREWLRTFLIGVNSEQQKFYAADYSRVIRSRSLIVSSVDSLWTTIYRRRFERFLTNTNQGTGDI